MAVDPYQLCPCGSGKKIKFCCNDLIGEMEKIYRMIEGDQPRAALRHVEQTLAKHPRRSSLLDMKAMLHFALGQQPEARATVDEFLQVDPKSPIAHAHDALAKADAGDPLAAVAAWQTAIDLCDDSIPARVYEALGGVANLLVDTGHILSARAHLWLFQALAPEEDDRALELLAQMNHARDIPLLLRDQGGLQTLPPDHPAADQVAEVVRLARNGRWRAAAELCDEILPDHLDQPLLFYNRALLSGFLADLRNCVAGLRLYARQPIDVDDAVEAEALAQWLDEDSHEPNVTDEAIELTIVDEDQLLERLQGHNQAVDLPTQSEAFQRMEGPKPRAYFLLLDRPRPDSNEPLTLDNVPRVVGSAAIYGRQTDRPERMELICEAGEPSERALEMLRSVAGDLVGEERGRQPHAKFPANDFASLDTLFFGTGQATSDRKAVLDAQRRQVIREWIDKPRRVLEGKTPREAAGAEALRLPLMASLLNLEQQVDDPSFVDSFAELRRELGLPELGPIDGSGIDGNTFPLVRVSRLKLSTGDDDSLVALYRRANMLHTASAIRQLSREILRRPSLADSLGKWGLYSRLVKAEPDLNAALGVLDEAREWAESIGESNGMWDLLEFQLHLMNNNLEGMEQVIAHIREEHFDEPEVTDALYRILASFGPMPVPGGAPGATAPPLEPVAPTSESRLWTPGGDSTSQPGSSKIWTPD